MRRVIASLLMSVAMAAPAFAETWSAEDSRLTFTTPEGWTTTRAAVTSRTYVVAREGDRQCHVLTMDRPATATRSPGDVRAASRDPLAPAIWERIPGSMPRVFGENARLVSTRIDADSFWPIHYGRYESADRVVHTAVQFRPGIEFWAFCFNGVASVAADDGSAYETIFRSLAAKDDEILSAEATQFDRAREAELRRSHERAMADHDRITEQFSSANVNGAMSTSGPSTTN